ncbi:MAG: restriction endonuclease subunit S [Bacteroidales bacterium]|nr:restriction endonuclease subunit S [Bacteroidales bacterium]
MKSTNVYISDIIDSQRIDVAYFSNSIGEKDYVALSKYVTIKGGKRIPKGRTFSSEQTDYLYLRLSEISDFERIDFEVFKCIDEDLFDILKRYEIHNNQIVFSIAGTIGKVFVLKDIPNGKRVILTENCAMIQPKDGSILPDYISILLNSNVVQKQIGQNRVQTTIPKIGLDRIAKLKVPKVPPIAVQQKIVEIYSQAQQTRLGKLQEAKELLNSIDDYLLEVLKIDKEQQRKEEHRRIQKNVSSIIGGRFDVSFHSEKFEMISTKYPNAKLSSLVEIDPSIKFNLQPDTTISFIPMECIDEHFGEISEYRETTISKTKGYTKFEENDLLWAKITPCMQNGKSAIARNLKNGLGCGSTEYYVMRPKNNEVLIEYIYLLLRHHDVLKAAQGSFGGSAGQQRVSSQYLKSVTIPYPDISTQKMIVDTIHGIKDKAKQLQKDGDALLEETKQRIEKMIIG